MRKQDKAIIWSAYFDQTKTRSKGRRVSRSLAVPHPRIEEIQDAAQKLGMKIESSIDAGYSKTPWQKTGMIRVEKKTPKEQILKVIAKQIIKARSAAAPAPTKK